MDIATNPTSNSVKRAWGFILIGWFIITMALFASSWFLTNSDQFGLSGRPATWVKALIMSGITVPGIIWLATRIDSCSLRQLGIPKTGRFIRHVLLGVGLIFIPFLLTLVISLAFGWVDVQFNTGKEVLISVFSGFAITFLFEALPEELAVRGYILHRLNTVYRRWLAGLISVGLFVLVPVILYVFNRYVLGIENAIGGASGLRPSYLIIMALFGSFLVYLRVLTNSIAMGMGFHLGFVHFDRIMGLESYHLIQFMDASGEGPIQMVLMICFVIMLVGLFMYPRWRGYKMGWQGYAMLGKA